MSCILILDGVTPQPMWNGNQQQPYHSSMSTRLDYSNQIPPFPPRPSPQYTDAINNTVPTNNRRMKQNQRFHFFDQWFWILVQSNDRWTNLPWTDPAIISLGNKLEPTSSSQRLTSTQLSSGNNLIPNRRWTPQPLSQAHLLTNGIYMPYSTTSGIDDGSRS